MPTPPTEYVYLIGSRKFGWYKIGKAQNPAIRVGDIGVLLPFKIKLFGAWATSRGLVTERLMHEKYAAYAINGEWFAMTLEVVVGILREPQPFDSSIVYSVFDPETYAKAEAIGIAPSFSNMEKDVNVVVTGVSKAVRSLKKEHAFAWVSSRGLEPCQANWSKFHKEIRADFEKKYGVDKERVALAANFIV